MRRDELITLGADIHRARTWAETDWAVALRVLCWIRADCAGGMGMGVARRAEPATVADKRSSVWISRRDVLIAARDLFEERGFEGTTTDDVASAARIAKRSLYRHFSSKEQLLFELHEDFVRALLQEADKLEGDPEERLRRMVASHIRILNDHRREVKVFLEEGETRQQQASGRTAAGGSRPTSVRSPGSCRTGSTRVSSRSRTSNSPVGRSSAR